MPPGLAAVARLLRAACRRVNAPVVFLCFYFAARLSRRSRAACRVPCKRSFCLHKALLHTSVTSHEVHGVSTPLELDCLFNNLFRWTTVNTSKFRTTLLALRDGNSPIVDAFSCHEVLSGNLTKTGAGEMILNDTVNLTGTSASERTLKNMVNVMVTRAPSKWP